MAATPLISIIVPVFNAEQDIEPFIQSLCHLHTPPDEFEILVVDNGSTDQTLTRMEACRSLLSSEVQILSETQVQGSYAARNKGLLQARGDLLAFTDIDCRPEPHWLAHGVQRLQDLSVDAVGGQVEFSFSSATPNGAEWVDAQTNMQMKQNIEERGVAKTANLFVRASLFQEVGPFRSDLRSGGDVEWTRRLTTSGFTLVYEPEAIVKHPARGYRELFKKQLRVGGGKAKSTAESPSPSAHKTTALEKGLQILKEVPWQKKPGVLLAILTVALGTLTGKLLARTRG